ncbi:aconitase X catalytic domain-containing protein [Candidatus Micrarchaeota archaeon]|nr:aconitase X catalytic domain-containing protein [Candidatus Micrarchaeota archaeon]
MELSEKEQKIFDGETNEAARQSMEILVALGKIYGAKRMIPIASAQISGVSYKTIGDAGLDYLKDLVKKGAKVAVPAFLNPAGMDIAQWKDMGIPEEFAKKQKEILIAYQAMGIMRTCTCTPYFVGQRPKQGEHIAWAESSAVSFANSILGARTNREGGPSALAAAICGITPEYGLHLDENRIADIVVEIQCRLETNADFGALGYAVGKLVKRKIPAFTGIKSAGEPFLKVLGASMAATGSVPLYYIKGITPEWKVDDDAEKIIFSQKQLDDTKNELDSKAKPDLVTIGCPHCSIDEIREVAELVKKKKPTCAFWVCTARKIKENAEQLGYSKIIENAGGIVVADTCMVVCPLEEMGMEVTGTNSGKAAKYLPNLCRQKVAFGDLKDILYR